MRIPRALSALLCMTVLCTSTHVHAGVLLDACSSDSDCDSGLYCGNCTAAGATAPRCVRSKATSLNEISSLPFNKVSWLVSHNSYAIVDFPDETGQRATFTNQEDNVTAQLNNGVRGLMLDTYDFKDDVWLCHSFEGVCYDATAFEPLLNTLIEVKNFLAANPNEIVTIFLEDYVKATNGLTKVFTAAGVTQYFFPLASMPTNGADWPTISTMIQKNWRLLMFTSKKAKQSSEGIAYQWNFVNENQYGNGGMQLGNCTNRAESPPLSSTSSSLILQNFFPTTPREDGSCDDNSRSLYTQLPTCYSAAGNRWANFLAVDFYKRSTGGGSFQALDKMNGQMECGCNSPASCQTESAGKQCSEDPTLAEYQSSFQPRGQGSSNRTSSTSNGDQPDVSPPSSSSGVSFGLLPLSSWVTILAAAIGAVRALEESL